MLALPAALLLALAAAPDAGPDAGPAPEVAWAETVTALENSLQASGVPGAALAVVVDGKLRFTHAVGVERLGTSTPVRPGTLFQWASVSKVLTAVAVLRLAERGALPLDTPLSAQVPELQPAEGSPEGEITLDQLLHHTSGLPSGSLPPDPALTGQEPDYLPRYLQGHPVPVLTPPGRLFNYSNLGFALLGLSLERAAKKPYEQAIRDEVLLPAGMGTATLEPSEAQAADHATGYSCGSGGLSQVAPDTIWSARYRRPFGGLQASVVDVAHFAEALLTPGRLLSEAGLARLAGDAVPTGETPDRAYARGVYVEQRKGARLLFHHGEQGGFASALLWSPERRFAVVVVANLSGYAARTLAFQAADAFLGLEGPEPEWKTPPATWRRYAGEYLDPTLLHRFRVRLKGEKLMLTLLEDGYTTELVQVAGDSFTFKLPHRLGEAQRTGTFWLDRRGRAEFFALTNAVGARAEAKAKP